jgi:3-phytase
MKLKSTKVMAILCASLMMWGCQSAHKTKEQTQATLVFSPMNTQQKVEAAQWVENDTFLPRANILLATKKQGIVILSQSGETLATLPGSYASLDHRTTPKGLILASVDSKLQQAVVTTFMQGATTWGKPLRLPKPNFKIEDACLYQDNTNNTFVFLVGEEGLGEQWLVGESLKLRNQALLVRSLSLPPASQFCQVDDATDTLYVNEENVGLWAYQAHAEAELAREPIAMRKPFGDIQGSATGFALQNKQLYLLDAEHQALHQYVLGKEGVSALPSLSLSTLASPEKISIRNRGTLTELLVLDDKGLHLASLPQEILSVNQSTSANIPMVKPLVQTDLMPSLGDAADDPAIWIHPTDARKSRVLGTDKQGGLAVYDLQGKQLQYLPVGRLNNVDVRAGFDLNNEMVDLAVATNRDYNSLHIFAIHRETGQVTELNQLPTEMNDIYGLCMFKDQNNQFYAIANDQDGRFEQYHLTQVNNKMQAKKVRAFNVGSQPEGCAVDDQTSQLFIGEEDVAVWTLDANATAPVQLNKVIGVNEVVKADIEGMAFYRGVKNSYLVFSSQGNDRYAVLDALPPYRLRGVFSIASNAELGIDGASETDGLDVTSVDLSGNHTGPWQQGMLVVQDGRKRMPVGNQNFKYIPWVDIAEALKLD